MSLRNQTRGPREIPDGEKPRYEKPTIVAHDETSLLDLVGPAVACARWDGAGSAESDDGWHEGGDDSWSGSGNEQ